jgi:hypothetical protein
VAVAGIQRSIRVAARDAPNDSSPPASLLMTVINVEIAGGGSSSDDNAVVEVPSPAVATGAGPADAAPPPAMGEDDHVRDGEGCMSGVSAVEGLGQLPPQPQAEASAADTLARAPGQGVNPASFAGPRAGASRASTRRASAASDTATGLTGRPTSCCPGLLREADPHVARRAASARVVVGAVVARFSDTTVPQEFAL